MLATTTMKLNDDEIFAQSFDGQLNLIAALRLREPSFDEACCDFLLLHRDLEALRVTTNERDKRYLAELHESIGGLRAEIEQKLRQAARPTNGSKIVPHGPHDQPPEKNHPAPSHQE